MHSFKAIAALSENRVIGDQGKLPWHLPDDLKWFKQLTTGKTIVMGRKTYESIGRPLPNRRTLVLSRSGNPIPGVEIIRSLDEVPESAWSSDIFIVGGGEIYQLALPLCSDLILTCVKRQATGDAFFPEFESDFERVEIFRETPEFSMERWSRKTRS